MHSNMAPLIIEVRANEFAGKDVNPNVPFGSEEMINDAIACFDAGATGYHWHCRDNDGIDRPGDAEINSSVIHGIRTQNNMLLHPTLGFTSTQGDASSRIANIEKLLSLGERPDIVPVDFGAIVSDTYNVDKGRFDTHDAVLLNKTGYLCELVEAISQFDIALLAVVWSPGGIRTALRLREMGLIRSPVYWQLGFTGEKVPGGLPPTVRQLEAFLDELPPGEPWNIHVRDGDGLSLAVEAMLRGGHIAIGLGDDPYLRLGLPSNADIVTRLTNIAGTIGRNIATPDDARNILGLSQ